MSWLGDDISVTPPFDDCIDSCVPLSVPVRAFALIAGAAIEAPCDTVFVTATGEYFVAAST